MSQAHEDVVKAAAGNLVEMNLLKEELEAAGIDVKLVGDDLATGLGSTLPGSVELWVKAADSDKASKLIQHSSKHSHRHQAPHQKFPHPESDPKPDRSQGPHHQPEPYRHSP